MIMGLTCVCGGELRPRFASDSMGGILYRCAGSLRAVDVIKFGTKANGKRTKSTKQRRSRSCGRTKKLFKYPTWIGENQKKRGLTPVDVL